MTEAEWWALVPASFRDRPDFAYVRDDPALPRVLLLGDSISMSYTAPVRRRLAGAATVHRAPDNCRSTRHSLADLDRYLGDGGWRVIHCNWGIHDITRRDSPDVRQVEVEEYGGRRGAGGTGGAVDPRSTRLTPDFVRMSIFWLTRKHS